MLKRNKIRDNKKLYALNWVASIVLIFYCITIIYPFIWTLLNSITANVREYNENYTKLLFFPKSVSFENFLSVFNFEISTGGMRKWSFLEMSLNTIWLSLALCVISMILPVCCSYCCAKYKFLGSSFFFYYGVVFCAIPLMGGTAISYKILYFLNIYDTYLARFYFAFMGSTWSNFLFLYAFFKGLSWSLAESGFIDGASDFQVFLHIMLPQVTPVLFTFFVLGFIGLWNDWMTSYLYTPSIPMVAYGVKKMVTIAQFGDPKFTWPMAYSALLLTMVVPLGLFAIFSDRILNTVYTGGLKG